MHAIWRKLDIGLAPHDLNFEHSRAGRAFDKTHLLLYSYLI